MKHATIILMTLALMVFPALGAWAMDAAHSGHDHGSMDHSGHGGKLIREAAVEGYILAYHLIDMREKMKNRKGMKKMSDTHHLMVYIKAPHGHAVETAKVGFLVEGPSGTKQKKMAMGMGGGFGSDVNLADTGAYSVNTKVVVDGKSLIDRFEHHHH